VGQPRVNCQLGVNLGSRCTALPRVRRGRGGGGSRRREATGGGGGDCSGGILESAAERVGNRRVGGVELRAARARRLDRGHWQEGRCSGFMV